MASDSRTSRPPRTSVWLEDRPAPRRRAAGRGTEQEPHGLDRERITEAAVRLLDAEGLAKFSMRRLAAELGVTAMSVYWYVDSKDDLLELALDSVMGEIALPDAADEDTSWQDQLRQLAGAYRSVFNHHPWLSQMMGTYINVGPRSMEFAEAAQRVMLRAGLPGPLLSGALSALFQFVFGFATVETNWNSRREEAGLTSDEFFSAVHAKVRTRPEYEDSLQLMAERGGDTVEEMRDRDFATALDCVIAGIEAMRPRP
ncbi:TetR/AcrR family transcriptional regulator [Streptomyces armeniacus]|uniref:TetR/AcrR family transcriptional regulator n=1 Tax=Streptomyces armeniacus TaxID=83291 RepID=A0A345XZ74_9ACTN|nr:TetR/AcrR family transcriptional regulator [Streptomyces armeniacus]AXK36940.1 TetR/AcrR family transcriptional regulator [Streptomyces armeniacus]